MCLSECPCQKLVNEEVCVECVWGRVSGAADFNLLFSAIRKLSFISSTVPSCNPSGDTSPGAHDSNTPMRMCMCGLMGTERGRG